MSDITMRKINESFSQIIADVGIEKELSDYLTFDVPNAQFMPQVKKGWWDGKIRLLDSRSNTLYTGLLTEVRKFCKQRGYILDTEGFDVKTEEINPKLLKEEILSWKPTKWKSGIKDGEREAITPYEEQILSIWLAMVQKRLIIESATSAGKSFIIAAICKLLRGAKTLIIVPRVDLATQLHDNFYEYFENWDIDIDVLYSGQELTNSPIVISTWQSICKMPPEYFSQFDVLIEDEVHEGEAKTTCEIVENCINAQYRIGLTGTLKDSLTHILTLRGLFGKDYLVSTAKDNMDKGISAQMDILIFRKKWAVKLKPDNKKWASGEKYKKELDFIHNSTVRNNLIVGLSEKMKGTNVVLFKYKEHGKLLYELLKEKNPNTFIIHGDVSKKQRDVIKTFAIENPTLDINIVASVGTFAMGINIPNIKSAILTCPLKGDNTKLRQAIGRGLRLKTDDSGFKFIDISDYVGNPSVLGKHHEQRVEKYIDQNFDYKVLDF